MPDLDEKQMQGLQKLLSVLDTTTPTRDEFTSNFKAVIDFVKQIDTRTIEDIKTIKANLHTLANSIDSKANSNIELSKNEAIRFMKQELGTMSLKQSEVAKMIENKLMEVKDGKDADEELIVGSVIEQISQPLVDKVGKNIPQLGGAIRDALELLKGDNRLDYKAIDGLEELIEELKNNIRASSSKMIGGGGVGKHNTKQYNLSASLDGVTRTFTLPAYYDIIDVKLSSVPVMVKDEDYTLNPSNSTITFTSEITLNDISVNQKCLIIYEE